MPEGDAIATHVDRIDRRSPVEVFSPARAGSVEHIPVHALDDPAHWHFVTIGLGPLGFELTFRLARTDADSETAVPAWALNFLANLAAYVFRTGHEFGAGHHVDLGGPIKLDEPTAITAGTLTRDPALGTLASAPGKSVEFLQVVGLTGEELELCRAWRTSAVVELLARNNPLLVTRLDRPSLLDDPALREEAEAGVAREGSSLTELRVASLRWRRRGWRTPRLTITLGAGAATGLGPALRRRLNRTGATFQVIGDEGSLVFVVADSPRWRMDGRDVVVEVPMADVDELAGLFTGKTGSGRVVSIPGLRFVVLP
jgi:hypothetical protein